MSEIGKAIKSISEQNSIRDTLSRALVHTFVDAGYSWMEAEHIASLAIRPISEALELSHQAYKLHIEAIQTGISIPLWLREKP